MKSFIEVQARKELNQAPGNIYRVDLDAFITNTMICLDDISAFQPCNDNKTLIFMRDVNLIVSIEYDKFKKIIIDEKTTKTVDINNLDDSLLGF